jgi:hypothetical protein
MAGGEEGVGPAVKWAVTMARYFMRRFKKEN